MSRNEHAFYGALGSAGQTIVTTICFFVLYRLGIDAEGLTQMGAWAVVLSLMHLAKLADFGLSGSLIPQIATVVEQEHSTAASSLFWTGLLFVSLSTLVATTCITVLLHYFSVWEMNSGKDIQPYLYVFLAVQVVLNTLSIFIVACLDGVGRVDIRSGINIASGVIVIITAAFLVPEYGLWGVIFCQILQFFLSSVVALVFIFSIYPQFRRVKLDINSLKKLVSYGSQFQLGSISNLSTEALFKFLIGRFGAVELVPVYEIFRKVYDQARVVMSVLITPLVPIAAGRGGYYRDDWSQNVQITLTKFLLSSGIVVFGAICMSSGWIFEILIGDFRFIYLLLIVLFSVTSVISLASVPAFYLNLAYSQLRWNTIAHLSYITTSFLFGWFGAQAYNIYGIAAGLLQQQRHLVLWCCLVL